MRGPAFDEPACINHPDRAAEYVRYSVTDPRETVKHYCLECRNALPYAPSRESDGYDSRDDMTPDGRNIRTAEANHKMLSNIAKEKPE